MSDDPKIGLSPDGRRLIEWAARSIVWGRLGVPVPSTHATAIGCTFSPREIYDSHRMWLAMFGATMSGSHR